MPFLPPQQPAVIHLDPGDRAAALKGIAWNRIWNDAAPQIWDGPRLFETGYGTLRELDRIPPARDFGKAPTDMAWYLTYDLVDGAAYAWGFGDDRATGQRGRNLQEIRSTLYIYRNGGARWELWDTLQTSKAAGISWLRPLEGGGYLLGGRFNDEEMHRADPFAIAQRNGHGKLVIHDTEEADLGAPTFLWGQPQHVVSADEAQATTYDRPRWMHNPKLYGAFDALGGPGGRILRVPGHLILVGQHLGIFIVVSARTGQVERVARLMDLPEDAMAQPEAYETAVLGAQPRPDGHLLIAARSAEAVQQSKTWTPDLPPPEPVRLSASEAFGKTAEEQGEAIEMKQDEADKARAREAQEARLKAFPDLIWWDFDPDTGAFRPEPPPAGVPAKFPSIQALKAFRFAFKPDGDLEIEPKVWR